MDRQGDPIKEKGDGCKMCRGEMDAALRGVGSSDKEGGSELVERCVMVCTRRATREEERRILKGGKVTEQKGEMGEGGVVRQDEREGGAVVSMDLEDEVMR